MHGPGARAVFSAPCGFGKATLAGALLRGQDVLRLSADDPAFALPPADGSWRILLLDDLQSIQEERDWMALCQLIRSCPDRRFVLLSRGAPPGELVAFQFTGLMTVLHADDLLFGHDEVQHYHFWPQFRAFLVREMEREYTEERRKALFSRGG